MKKVFIFSFVASVLLVACGENKKSETPVQTEQPPMSMDSTAMKNMESIKPAVDKKTQDSIDAAHGHSH